MYTDVYADILFLINFSMDAVSLYVSARLCCAKISALRIAIGAAIGGMYSVLSIFLGLYSSIEFVVFLLVCVVMSTVSLVPDGLAQTFKYSAVTFISSCLLGGVMSALYASFNVLFLDDLDNSEKTVADPLVFILLAVLSMACALFLCRLHGTGSFPKSVDCEISVFGKRITVRGIVDSGNMLKDPLSGKSVIVVSSQKFKYILSGEFLDGAEKCDIGAVNLIKENEKRRFRLIPAKGIDKGTYLFGVIPDAVFISYKKKGKLIRLRVDVVVALFKDKDLGGEIKCVIPQTILR